MAGGGCWRKRWRRSSCGWVPAKGRLANQLPERPPQRSTVPTATFSFGPANLPTCSAVPFQSLRCLHPCTALSSSSAKGQRPASRSCWPARLDRRRHFRLSFAVSFLSTTRVARVADISHDNSTLIRLGRLRDCRQRLLKARIAVARLATTGTFSTIDKEYSWQKGPTRTCRQPPAAN